MITKRTPTNHPVVTKLLILSVSGDNNSMVSLGAAISSRENSAFVVFEFHIGRTKNRYNRPNCTMFLTIRNVREHSYYVTLFSVF